MPPASHANTSHTVMRNPRTHGWPERLPGSIVMRERDSSTIHLLKLENSESLPEGGGRTKRAEIPPCAHRRFGIKEPGAFVGTPARCQPFDPRAPPPNLEHCSAGARGVPDAPRLWVRPSAGCTGANASCLGNADEGYALTGGRIRSRAAPETPGSSPLQTGRYNHRQPRQLGRYRVLG